MKDLLSQFKDNDILRDEFNVKRVGNHNTDFETGDGIGFIRDVLSECLSVYGSVFQCNCVPPIYFAYGGTLESVT